MGSDLALLRTHYRTPTDPSGANTAKQRGKVLVTIPRSSSTIITWIHQRTSIQPRGGYAGTRHNIMLRDGRAARVVLRPPNWPVRTGTSHTWSTQVAELKNGHDCRGCIRDTACASPPDGVCNQGLTSLRNDGTALLIVPNNPIDSQAGR